MDARSVTGFSVSIDSTAVPHRFQSLNPRRDNAPRRFAVGRRNQPDATSIAFIFGPIHAIAGKAFMFGGREVLGHAAIRL